MLPRQLAPVCFLAALLLAPALHATPEYEVLTTFERGPASPYNRLVQAPDGSFYGVLSSALGYNQGALFKVSPAGTNSFVVNFTGNGALTGSNPGELIVGNDGNFYGTTATGGANGLGTFFQLSPAGIHTTLFSFNSTNASAAGSQLIQVSDGNFYGPGRGGNYGSIIKMTPAGALTTLATFTGAAGAVRGAFPIGQLVQDTNGDFYGVTSAGGALLNRGTAFKITSAGLFASLVDFTYGAGCGTGPNGGLALGNDGNFYGTSVDGGTYNTGTVFQLTPAGALTPLASFGPKINLVAPAPTRLIRGSDGDFYGTTHSGGANNHGTIFKITSAGVFTTLAELTGTGGALPGSYPNELSVGNDGAFYGTAAGGGTGTHGVVFRITPAGSYSTVIEFNGGLDPAKPLAPQAGLVLGADGAFYGIGADGGAHGLGTVFKTTPAGTVTTLVHFSGTDGTAKGKEPSSLILGSDGNFYGTTVYGGASDHGTVFKMAPDGTLTTLVEFSGTNGPIVGYAPVGSLVEGSPGIFYGTTRYPGTIFKISSGGVFTTLYQFGSANPAVGGTPTGRMVVDASGNLYGGADAYGGNGGANGFGTIFKMTPAGVLTPLVQFTGTSGAAKGTSPGDLSIGSDGMIYGTTSAGGADNYGTIFKMTLNGALTTLVEFTGSSGIARGKSPSTALQQASDGNFYGATNTLGANGFGTIYKMSSSGVFTTLFDLTEWTGAAPGNLAYGSLLLAPDGGLYGGAYRGGPSWGGVLWRLLLEHAPDVNTQAAGTITTAGAILAGSIIANRADTTAAFEFGLTPALGGTIAATPAPITGSTATAVTATLTGLAPHTAYYYRASATNSEGTTTGGILSFTTLHTFTAWAAEKFGAQAGNPAVAGPLANPDGDALVNLLEYALGTEPTAGGNLFPEVTAEAGYLTLTYTRPKDRGDLSYIVEVAPAPGAPWQSNDTTLVSIVDHGATETLKVRSTTSIGSIPEQVIRLRIVLTSP